LGTEVPDDRRGESVRHRGAPAERPAGGAPMTATREFFGRCRGCGQSDMLARDVEHHAYCRRCQTLDDHGVARGLTAAPDLVWRGEVDPSAVAHLNVGVHAAALGLADATWIRDAIVARRKLLTDDPAAIDRVIALLSAYVGEDVPTMHASTVIVHADGTAETPGVDHSTGSKPLRVVKRTRDLLVLFIPGGSGWASVGESRYYAARFAVYRILRETAEGHLRVQEMTEFPARPKTGDPK
jgi:hypothetical protein